MSFWVLILILSPVFIIIGVLRNQRQQSEAMASTAELFVDGHGVSRQLADGRREAIDWHEVSEVDVFTTRVGPHKATGGALVLYGDHERGCIVPLDQVGTSGLVDQLRRLPGFDVNGLLAAMGVDEREERDTSGNPVRFLLPKPLQVTTVLWTRADPEPDPDPDP